MLLRSRPAYGTLLWPPWQNNRIIFSSRRIVSGRCRVCSSLPCLHLLNASSKHLLYVWLSVHASINPIDPATICPPIHPSVHPHFCLSTHLSIHPSFYLSTYPSIYVSIPLCTHPCIDPSILGKPGCSPSSSEHTSLHLGLPFSPLVLHGAPSSWALPTDLLLQRRPPQPKSCLGLAPESSGQAEPWVFRYKGESEQINLPTI